MSDAAIQLGESTVKLLAECDRLRAENDGYKQAMRANNMTADAHYLERHIREACLKLGGSACRDGMPMGEGLIREIENLRATAISASEAAYIDEYLPCPESEDDEKVLPWVQWTQLMQKVSKIAHPEPPEGSNG